MEEGEAPALGFLHPWQWAGERRAGGWHYAGRTEQVLGFSFIFPSLF